MNSEVLLGSFMHSPRLFQLADRLLLSQPQRIACKNLQGSSPAFLISAVFQHDSTSQLNHLVVCEDAEAAAYLHNTIESLTGALDLFYFPSSFKNKKNYRLLNSSHVMLRTEALTRLSAAKGTNKKIIVTYPEAVFEKVVLPKTLSSNIISIKSGSSIDTDKLIETLINYGFERTDFVYEPGQVALRGGILDIYSFGNEKPYRVELFGNDVDSIRIFDPETQLSERRLLQVNIIPNVEDRSDTGEKISLLEFIPDNTVIWMQDWAFTRERLIIQEEDLSLFLEHRAPPTTTETEEDKVEKREVTREDFVTAGQIESRLEHLHLVEFGPSAASPFPSAYVIEFHTRPQPAFNRQFELLIRDLRALEAKKYTLYLFAENPRQLERLYTIFEVLNAAITFTPVTLSIHEGFIDEDLKIACYTDHQIFQRYHKYKVKQA